MPILAAFHALRAKHCWLGYQLFGWAWFARIAVTHEDMAEFCLGNAGQSYVPAIPRREPEVMARVGR